MKPAHVIAGLCALVAAAPPAPGSNTKSDHPSADGSGFPRSPLLDLNRHSLVSGVTYTTPLRGVTLVKLAAAHEPAEDAVSGHVSALWPVHAELDGHSAVSAMSRVQKHVVGASYQNITALNRYSTQYGIECEWDGKPVWLLFDTGSSDTWAVRSDFHCVDRIGTPYPRAACQHGGDFVDEFRYGELPMLHFSLQFGSGEKVSGPMGISDISTAGITVGRLQVGLANETFWRGNNITNGILGLAFSSLTSAYYGDPDEDREQYRVPYAPFMAALVAQGTLKNPFFSVALERGSSTGLMAWGGLPPSAMTTGPVAASDLIITKINPSRPETAWKYSYYTILVDAMQWDQTTDEHKYLYIVDTGTTLMYLPPPMAESIAAAFEPRAIFLWQYGSYFAPCDAVPPRLAVHIGGVPLWLSPSDLIYRNLRDPSTGYCQIGIASGGSGPYILGDVFLQNVVAVFDVGAAQMRFYSRQ